MKQKISEIAKREGRLKIQLEEYEKLIESLKGQIVQLNMSQSMVHQQDNSKQNKQSELIPHFLNPPSFMPPPNINKPEKNI